MKQTRRMNPALRGKYHSPCSPLCSRWLIIGCSQGEKDYYSQLYRRFLEQVPGTISEFPLWFEQHPEGLTAFVDEASAYMHCLAICSHYFIHSSSQRPHHGHVQTIVLASNGTPSRICFKIRQNKVFTHPSARGSWKPSEDGIIPWPWGTFAQWHTSMSLIRTLSVYILFVDHSVSLIGLSERGVHESS